MNFLLNITVLLTSVRIFFHIYPKVLGSSSRRNRFFYPKIELSNWFEKNLFNLQGKNDYKINYIDKFISKWLDSSSLYFIQTKLYLVELLGFAIFNIGIKTATFLDSISYNTITFVLIVSLFIPLIIIQLIFVVFCVDEKLLSLSLKNSNIIEFAIIEPKIAFIKELQNISQNHSSFVKCISKYFSDGKIFKTSADQSNISLVLPSKLSIIIKIDNANSVIDYKDFEVIFDYDCQLKELNWSVIRFSQIQIDKYPKNCCKLIAQLICAATGEQQYLSQFKNVGDLPKHYLKFEQKRFIYDRQTGTVT